MSKAEAPVLMSPENPEGWKLEELATQLIKEVTVKCEKVKNNLSPEAQRVYHNNQQIMMHLAAIKEYQDDTLETLDKIGPDQGPLGKPRIGPGNE